MPINTPNPIDIPNTHKMAIAHLCCTLLNSATLDHDLAFHAHSLPFIPNAIQPPNEIKAPTYGMKFTIISTKANIRHCKRPKSN